MNIETVADTACATGECPVWHPDEACLYWTDIPAGVLYRYDPASGRHEVCYRDRPVGGMTVQHDGALLLFRDKGNIALLREGQLTPVIDAIPGLEQTRFNDVIADPHGRVFAGTMSFGDRENGRLYRIDPDGSYHVVSDGHATPNGMGFSPDGKGLYFTDSRRCRIYRFDVAPDTGELSNPRIFTETAPEEVAAIGRSDGMTVDREGHLWSARWDGGHILRYAPNGSIVRRIPMPARKISSLAFGGADLCDLYATSAGGRDRGPADPHAGALFRLRPGAAGVPEFRSRIGG